MKNQKILISLLTLATIIFTFSCGPSSEEIATMTAAAEPTPIPYDLSLTVTDQDGATLSGVSVNVNSVAQITNESGMTVWENLPSSSATLSISAPGYFSKDLTETLERGENQLEVVLEQDANGLLPVNACAPSETLLYIDDFQDGEAQGWEEIQAQAPGWSLEGDPDNTDDTVAVAQSGANWSWLGGHDGYSLDNVVWRMWYKTTGSPNAQFNFRYFEDQGSNARYIYGMHPQGASLARLVDDQHFDLQHFNRPANDAWHFLEFSYFDGEVQLWIDRQEIAAYNDPQPWTGGTINLEPFPDSDATFYFDDISLCQLSEAFISLPKPKTGYNLTVTVTDAESNPVPFATISVGELGSDPEANKVTDENGEAAWIDLPKDTITLDIGAPGFFQKQISQVVEKEASTTATVQVEKDPNGLALVQACAPGETLLYIEDFQDQVAQNIPEINYNAGGWSVINFPETENYVASLAYSGSQGVNSVLENHSFENAVWRFKVYLTERFVAQNDGLSFNWLQSTEPFSLEDGTEINDSRYQIPTGWNYFSMRRLQQPITNIGIAQVQRPIKAGQWTQIEISTLDGYSEVWMDGSMLMKYQDPQPLPAGSFSIEAWLSDKWPTVYFDDIAVCGLEAPFTSIFADD